MMNSLLETEITRFVEMIFRVAEGEQNFSEYVLDFSNAFQCGLGFFEVVRISSMVVGDHSSLFEYRPWWFRVIRVCSSNVHGGLGSFEVVRVTSMVV
ncbi:hypothetical protein RRG08_000387 [Elysia crispata]|uniref:Uncharacterized protein n=1 Tax=Elysia crispata TaxID=231223 RepID=A0AAE1A2W3_9GAST|nr:hypothetical protein RRG08_000387 [Elysia crispata]